MKNNRAMIPTFYVKPELEITDLCLLTPHMITLLGAFVMFATNNNLPVTVTSMCDDVSGRVSTTHREGRAVDFSTRGWEKKDIDKAIAYFKNNWGHIGAIGRTTGRPLPLVYHKISGGVDHFHLQARRFPTDRNQGE